MAVSGLLLLVGGVALLSARASSDKIGLDLYSNGHYWWGGPWSHKPANGDTSDCVCVKGTDEDGRVTGFCAKGVKFDPRNEESFLSVGSWDTSKPIDISIFGSDALWIDRFQLNTSKGRRDYGSNNSIGWCLSTNPNDQFDKWAIHEGCEQTLSLNPNGNVYAYGGLAGHYRDQGILDATTKTCQTLNTGRRRVEAGQFVPVGTAEGSSHTVEIPSSSPQGSLEPEQRLGTAASSSSSSEESSSEEVERAQNAAFLTLLFNPSVGRDLLKLVGMKLLGSDGATTPLAKESPDIAEKFTRSSQVIRDLHRSIGQLVEEKDAVTDDEIDTALNDAALEAEQREAAEAHEGEVIQIAPSLGSAAGAGVQGKAKWTKPLDEVEEWQ